MTQDFVIKPINLWANYPSCTTGMSGLGTEQQAQYVNIFFLISPAAEASASACAGVRFIIRKRSYRAWGIRIYKSCTASANPCSETINHQRGPFDRFERTPSRSHSRPLARDTSFIISFSRSFSMINSILFFEYDCSSFCYCVLLWYRHGVSFFDRNPIEMIARIGFPF